MRNETQTPGPTPGCDCPADGILEVDQHAAECSYAIADRAPKRPKTYGEIAGDYALTAGKLLGGLDYLTDDGLKALADGISVPAAQVAATLSLAARIADLTERLEKSIEYVGDRIDAQGTP